VAILLALTGCASTSEPATGDLARDLRHPDPRIRAYATKQVAEAQRTDLLDPLIQNLSDPDPAVRMFSAVALRKLTGQDLDFRPYGTVSEREAGIDRWKRWLEESRRAESVAPPQQGAGTAQDPNAGGSKHDASRGG
jgi:hypothetical protein